jgi:hypothetical protein
VLILDVWWFNIPAPVEWRGPPRLKTPITPSDPQILNTHKEIWDQNELVLILDVWWFNIPTPVELRGPLLLKNPNSTFKPSNFKHLQRNLNQKLNWANFRCSVIWSWYIPQALEIPIFRFKKYIYKEKWTNHHVMCNFNIHLNDFKVCGKNKCHGRSINHKTLT